MKKQKMTLSKLSLKKNKLVALHAQEQVVGGSGRSNCITVCNSISVNVQCPINSREVTCPVICQ